MRGVRRALAPQLVFFLLLSSNLVVRFWLAWQPGYEADMEYYRSWARAAVLLGVPATYEAVDVDYPPLLLYPLYGAGLAAKVLGNGLAEEDARRLLTFWIKTIPWLADLGLAAVLAWSVRRLRLCARTALLPWAPVFYLWNPAVLWNSGYWGQMDSVYALLIFGSVVLLLAGRPALAWASAAVGCLTKPLPVLLTPFLGLVTWLRGARIVAYAMVGAAIGVAVVFAPFVVAGNIRPVLSKIFTDVEAMPVTSANAHNLWWLLGPWRDANAPVLGPLTPKWLGIALFAAACALVGWRAIRARSAQRLTAPLILRMVLAVSVALFFFLTHLHENHLFLAIPFAVAMAGSGRRDRDVALLTSAVVFVNEVLHDDWLVYSLPGCLATLSPVLDPRLHHPYTWLQVVGSLSNSIASGFLTVIALKRACGAE